MEKATLEDVNHASGALLPSPDGARKTPSLTKSETAVGAGVGASTTAELRLSGRSAS